MPLTSSRSAWIGDLTTGILAYLLTSAPVLGGIFIGRDFIKSPRSLSEIPTSGLVQSCFHFDAPHYANIVEYGYSYDPEKQSTVAFFPGYPLAGQLAVALTGADHRLALLVVANLMLAGAFVVFAAYLRGRDPQASARTRWLVLALFGLWPAGFFFRMPYAESTFLLLSLLAMYGMIRRWPLPVLALLTGAATGTRPVGLAVTLAFLWYILFDAERGTVKRRLLLATGSLPLACWGLLAYMAFQYVQFETPLAFAQTQNHWYQVRDRRDLGQKVEALLALEPIWSVYTNDPERGWWRIDSDNPTLFSLFFWNPILFVAAAGLVLLGDDQGWLSGPETILGLGLLAIPYATRAYEMAMASHARFAAVVFPAYIVLGRLLGPRPEWLTWAILSLLTMMLFAWTALYVGGYLLF